MCACVSVCVCVCVCACAGEGEVVPCYSTVPHTQCAIIMKQSGEQHTKEHFSLENSTQKNTLVWRTAHKRTL